MNLGPFKIENNLLLAPMVGVCDVPFREVCDQQGAGLTFGEMVPCEKAEREKERHLLRQTNPKIKGPKIIQIAGSDAEIMSSAALYNEKLGADAIDINMGCPAKKVLKKAAGSSLLRDTKLVEQILRKVTSSVTIPVTLKIRTGWCPNSRNGSEIARIAEDCGIQLLTIHGRTRADRFMGHAEYDTIAQIKETVKIPIIANGDIDSPEKAKAVLEHTKADGLMIGRAAQGRPWIFNEIDHFLKTGLLIEPVSLNARYETIKTHVAKLHKFYGGHRGALYARKHITQYFKPYSACTSFLKVFNTKTEPLEQLDLIDALFDQSANSFLNISWENLAA
ncbi:MAG: tRNA dihydrouridine synthase DusB [Gammaproteobacteria bacterium]|nr:tRNA dihydrouridine synthase DusB [Gammaproteobacteria bacterium]MDG2117512.1 tRNA dihydrouridine synthase DusB [Gammaproteobacteria bacterium]